MTAATLATLGFAASRQLSLLASIKYSTPSQHHDGKMPSLLVVIFAIELAVQVINNFGAANINSVVSDAHHCTTSWAFEG